MRMLASYSPYSAPQPRTASTPFYSVVSKKKSVFFSSRGVCGSAGEGLETDFNYNKRGRLVAEATPVGGGGRSNCPRSIWWAQRHGGFTENLKTETRIFIFFSEIVTSFLNAQNTLFRLLFGASPSLHNSSAVELLSAALHDYAGSSTIIHARVEAPSARGAFISV